MANALTEQWTITADKHLLFHGQAHTALERSAGLQRSGRQQLLLGWPASTPGTELTLWRAAETGLVWSIPRALAACWAVGPSTATPAMALWVHLFMVRDRSA